MLLTPVFLIKLILTPVLMLGVSIAAKKWGTFWGGLLSGLPLTSGVILTFLAVEQGAGFTQTAILGAIPGLAAVMSAYKVYATLSKRWPIWHTASAALLAFVLVSGLNPFQQLDIGCLVIAGAHHLAYLANRPRTQPPSHCVEAKPLGCAAAHGCVYRFAVTDYHRRTTSGLYFKWRLVHHPCDCMAADAVYPCAIWPQ